MKVIVKHDGLLKGFLENNSQVEFIKCQIADMQGNNREVTLTREEIGNTGKTTTDGSSVFGKIIPPTESDMVLVTDPTTIFVLPWSPDTAKVICNIYHPPETEGGVLVPFEGCGRGILIKVTKTMESVVRKYLKKKYPGKRITNIKALFAPELEFLLMPKKYDYTKIHLDTNLKNDNYFVAPDENVEEALKDMIRHLGVMGLRKEKFHTEVASMQVEIGIGHSNVLHIADGTMTAKYVIAKMAKRHGLKESFAPKFNQWVNGSGMHIHINLSAEIDGEEVNLFYDETCEDCQSEIMKWCMAGLLKYSNDITAIANPLPICYKRLVPNAEAPTRRSWGWLNRTALLRGHSKGTKKIRIEFRSPDPKCNIYLASAGIISAMVVGIKEELKLCPADDRNLYYDNQGVEELPGNLGEALAFMNQSKMLRQYMGNFIIDSMYGLGINEWREYCRAVTDYDIRRYL